MRRAAVLLLAAASAPAPAAAQAGQYEGGSIAPMIAASCVERLTPARIIDLQQFLN